MPPMSNSPPKREINLSKNSSNKNPQFTVSHNILQELEKQVEIMNNSKQNSGNDWDFKKYKLFEKNNLK